MAYQELRCKNCASLIRFKQEEDQYCIFCHAPNTHQEALEASNDPNFVYPHKQYEQPDEASLNQALSLFNPNKHQNTTTRKTSSSKPTQAQEKQKVQQEKENFTPLSKEVTQIQTNMKVLWVSVASFIAIVALMVGMTIPLTLQRNKARTQILASLAQQGVKGIEESERVDFRSQDNKEFTLILKEEATEALAKEYFEKFQKALQSTYGDQGIEDLSKIKLSLLNAKKSYYVSFDKETNSLKITSSGK